MPGTTYVPKACAYVTRRDARQLLVFQGPSTDAWQIPKGTIEPNESPKAGLRRELAEESGLTEISHIEQLHTDVWQRRPGRKYVRYFFHVSVEEPRDAWTHVVTGDGAEEGERFHYEWADRPVTRELWLELDDYLSHLPTPARVP